MALRDKGLSVDEVFSRLSEMRRDDARWRDGKTWSLVYSAGDNHDEFLKSVYTEFFNENGLSPSAFPSLGRMEREVVHDLIEHTSGDPSVAGGTMTSGGTESIILAVKAYRDSSRVDNPSMIVPITAHPAFRKAGDLLGVDCRVVPMDETYRVDPNAVRDAIDETTVLISASAPSYPFGLVDPIFDLGEIAGSNEVGLHIDACLGGLPLPFIRQLGRQVPDFGFDVSGVTSISVDLHKYGYAAKGASAILYSHRELRNSQFTVFTDWPGGVLTSPTLLGTRPGGAIAAAWAALNGLGTDGYLKIFDTIMSTVDKLAAGIRAIGDLETIGEPPMSVFAVTSRDRDVFAIADVLQYRGWRVDRQTGPDSIHHIVNPRHEAVVDDYLRDLGEAYEEAPASQPGVERQAFYGVTGRISPTDDLRAALVEDLGRRYDS